MRALRRKSDRPFGEYEFGEKLMSTRINALHLTWTLGNTNWETKTLIVIHVACRRGARARVRNPVSG